MTNILPFEGGGPAEHPQSLQFKVKAYQKVIRTFAQHLDAFEFTVLMQVLDRTAGWGDREASFTSTALHKGDNVYSGIAKAMGRSKMFMVLASLEAKGILRRRQDAHKPDKRHYRINLEWTPSATKIPPKRPKNGAADRSATRTTPSMSRTTPSTTWTLYTGNHLQVINTGNHTGAPASRAAVIKTEKNSGEGGQVCPAPRDRTRRDAQNDGIVADAARIDRRPDPSTAASIEHIWRLAVTETFEGAPVPAWGTREKGQAKTALKKWREHRISFHDFVEWCARNWTAIMHKQFGWMTKQAPPNVPALPFLFSFMDGFVECYAEGKLDAWLNSRDRTELERLMAAGSTYEQATATLAKRAASKNLRDEMEKREAAVKLESRVAKIRLQKAEKLADLGAAPPHPQSVAGQRVREVARRATSPAPAPISPDVDLTKISVPFVDPRRNPFDQ